MCPSLHEPLVRVRMNGGEEASAHRDIFGDCWSHWRSGAVDHPRRDAVFVVRVAFLPASYRSTPSDGVAEQCRIGALGQLEVDPIVWASVISIEGARNTSISCRVGSIVAVSGKPNAALSARV